MSSEEKKVDHEGRITQSCESNSSLSLFGEDIEESRAGSTHDLPGEDSDESRAGSMHDLLGEDIEESCAGSTHGQDPTFTNEANGAEIAASFSNKSDQSSKDRGKPPRATRRSTSTDGSPTKTALRVPLGVQRSTSTDTGPIKTAHQRNLSTAEYSSMSALTDDGEDGVDLPLRNRTISWDFTVAREFGEEADPLFGETSRTTVPSPPPLSPPMPPSSMAAQRWGTVRASLLIDKAGLTENPMELEAETAILRVIEKTRKRDAAKAGNILPHVPEEAVNAFQSNLAQEVDDKSLGETSVTRSSGHSAIPKGSGHSAMRMGHKRTTTLESTLFDLGAQMDRLKQDKEEVYVGRERLMSRDSRAGHESLLSKDQGSRERFLSRDIQTDKGNSGDVLAKNAEILFRRPIAKKDPSLDALEVIPPVVTSPVQSRTSFMSVQSGDRKKTDGDDDIPKAGDSDSGSNENDYDIEAPQLSDSETKRKFGFLKAGKGAADIVREEVKEDFGYFWQFLKPRSRGIKFFLTITIFVVIVPANIIAAILFYTENPALGREGASTSWLILFLCRQAVTFMLAKAMESLIIDFLSLQLRLTVRLLGPMFTLLFVQSKGFPFIIFSWGVFNFCLNSGENSFAQHWLFWQDLINLYNKNNPSGTIAYSDMNFTINGTAVVIGFIVALKRMWWGLYLGKRSYLHYGDELATVVKNMISISEVANLGKDMAKYGDRVFKKRKLDPRESHEVLSGFFGSCDNVADTDEELPVVDDNESSSEIDDDKVIDEERKDKFTGTLSHSQKLRMEDLLGKWEEPDTVAELETDVSIASILQFRQMLAYMDEDYPFSLAYGPADTRESCIESAQKLYQRLIGNTLDLNVRPFESIVVLAKTKDGDIDTERMKDLIKLFRPDRQGNLTMLDFVKSCDSVYKEMRLLRASIANSGQIDHAFEIMINVFFYVILAIIVLAVLGVNPLSLFLSISGIVLAFAFMIGSASSKYFEGILFILVRRPYDIGDRINVADVNDISSGDGSSTWFVQNVDLFTTTVRYAFTNEVATLANGSLAASRIINAKRSPRANVYVYMKFSVNVSYQKILVFRKTIEAFVKERPREYRGMNGFRATRLANEQGYVEYVICLEHRESWQNIAVILQSKADVSSFCLEVSKKLNMTYTAPPLPVNLSLAQPNMQLHMEQARSCEGHVPDTSENASSQTPSSPDFQSIAAMFGGKQA